MTPKFIIMKKLFSGANLVFLLSLTLSLFVTNQVQAQENNVTIVPSYANLGLAIPIEIGNRGWSPPFAAKVVRSEYHVTRGWMIDANRSRAGDL